MSLPSGDSAEPVKQLWMKYLANLTNLGYQSGVISPSRLPSKKKKHIRSFSELFFFFSFLLKKNARPKPQHHSHSVPELRRWWRIRTPRKRGVCQTAIGWWSWHHDSRRDLSRADSKSPCRRGHHQFDFRKGGGTCSSRARQRKKLQGRCFNRTNFFLPSPGRADQVDLEQLDWFIEFNRVGLQITLHRSHNKQLLFVVLLLAKGMPGVFYSGYAQTLLRTRLRELHCPIQFIIDSFG